LGGEMNNAPTVGIGRLLSENCKYKVPQHQRDYSWSEDEIDQLFIDIDSSIGDENDEYFLGLMVFIPESTPEHYSILDGQQRLVTTSIILSSIRNWLGQHGRNADSEKLQNDFIGVREYGETELTPRLELNINNNAIFYDYVVQEKPLEEIEIEISKHKRYSPSYLLLKSIIYCRKKIVELAKTCKTTDESVEYLFRLVKYIRDNIKVVRLVVPNESNAYTVFETLNARGLELSSLDLVKNHIFGKASSQTELRNLQANWAEMVSNIGNTDSEDFLKTYWTSRFGRIQVTKLFTSVKAKYNTYSLVKDFTRDLVHVSEQFENIYVSESSLWSSFTKRAKNNISVLQCIGSRQLQPVLLAAIDKFENHELEKLLDFLEVFIVRYQLIVGGRTGLIEIACANLARKIFDGSIVKASKAKNELMYLYPDDKTFYESFLNKQEKTSKKAYLLLHKLEIQRQKEAGKTLEFQPYFDLTIEHILPKNPNHDWFKVFSDKTKDLEEYKYKLGNLCLLGEVNKSLGSKGYSEKVVEYRKTSILLTSMVSDFDTWNYESIDSRQKTMAELALRTWTTDLT
jgi:uncharacterized protein with ParB-like and HNH nuclease domain